MSVRREHGGSAVGAADSEDTPSTTSRWGAARLPPQALTVPPPAPLAPGQVCSTGPGGHT